MKNLIVIASSAGGPEALKILVPSLPKNIAASIVVIQHMPIGFTDFFARRLDDLSEIDVREIKNDIRVKRGKVYIAKSGSQIRLVKNIRSVYFKSFEDKTDNLLKPSADKFLETLKPVYYDRYICVVLSGMGNDATRGIENLKEHNNAYVICQNEESSKVFSMPGSVIEKGYADEVLDINDIAPRLVELTKSI